MKLRKPKPLFAKCNECHFKGIPSSVRCPLCDSDDLDIYGIDDDLLKVVKRMHEKGKIIDAFVKARFLTMQSPYP